MRRWMSRGAPCALVLVATRVTGAQELRVGAEVEYSEDVLFYDRPEGSAFDHWDTIGGSLLLDAEYLRVGAGESSHFGALIHNVDGREGRDDGYRMEYLNLTVLGKLPLRFGRSVVMWPTLGLRGAYCLRYSHQGPPAGAVDGAPHDLYLAGGDGINVELSSTLAATGAVLVLWNLTPSGGIEADHRIGIGAELSAGVVVSL
jgi:hypothetical protein